MCYVAEKLQRLFAGAIWSIVNSLVLSRNYGNVGIS
jgi:hypothetical protein